MNEFYHCGLPGGLLLMVMDSSHEFQFVHHLFKRIKDELTGRSVDETLVDGPRDRFPAGVLLPLQLDLPTAQLAQNASQEGSLLEQNGDSASELSSPKADSESVMSIDFQVSIPEDAEDFILRVTPHFSVYYAVFPTRAEAQTSHGQHGEDEEVEDDDSSSIENADASSDPMDQEAGPDIAVAKEDVPQGIPHQVAAATVKSFEKVAQSQPDTLLLPRKFRKRQIEFPPLEISLSPENLIPPLEIRDPIDSILADARASILQEDTSIWKHLGPPEKGQREIQGRDLLASDDSYQAALRMAASGDAALPTWRAYLTISGEQTLLGSPNATNNGRIFRINVALINATPGFPKTERQRAQLEECALFDCGFSLEIEGADLIPFEFLGTPKDYRYDRSMNAIGSNCVAMDDGKNKLCTETVPLYEQPWYRTREDLPVAFEELDDGPTSNVLERLRQISTHMDAYLTDWNAYLTSNALKELDAEEIKSCQKDRENFAEEVRRFKWGIKTLENDPQLLRAFRLMNRVFRENGERRTPPIKSWRLFQLVFMVIQLPALAAREGSPTATGEYAEVLQNALERVDVLWFPTGGGKTEAYLGLITTALFYDRLRGKNRGVSAWMRFPLRMLSLQQLERLALTLARAEMIRSEEHDLNSLQNDPFAIGYYVGGGNTPNRIREDDLPRGSAADTAWERQQIIRHCPFCNGDVHIIFNRKQWRLLHVCQNPSCYTNTSESLQQLRGSIPIFVVDNEIYRYRPAVLVGTVDKLAVIGFQKHFAHITSAVTQQCPDHGYASFGQCVESSGNGPCKRTLKDFVHLQPDKDPVPAFLIQDELHLLKEDLGTFNAHYEGFLGYLAEQQGQKPSKILAATATIEAYEAQTFHLYLKDANRFPQPGWLSGESFYATSQPRAYRRLYGGVLSHQRSPESAALRILGVYHQEIQRMRDDPTNTLAALGFQNVTEEAFLDFLHLYDLSLSYVNRKATGGNIVYGLHQTVEPQLPHKLGISLLTADNTMTEVGHVIERIERERHTVEDSRLDALVATSLISHGVDLERINFLCMVGMPSKYAEYIQASSRAARNHVGLVMVCFKRIDLRERSQFHYFLPNHLYLDRLVEPVPINRFSSFAVQRTVPGLIVGLLLSHYSRILYNKKQITRSLDNMHQLRKIMESGIITFEQLIHDLQHIIGVQHPKLNELQQRYLIAGITQALQENWDQIQRSFDSQLGDAVRPMLSFRDVDETLDFVADGASGAFVEQLRAT